MKISAPLSAIVRTLSTRTRRRSYVRSPVRAKKLRRYNNQSYDILSAWIELLLGAVGQGAPVTVTYGSASAYPAAFTVSTRTAFSRRGAA